MRLSLFFLLSCLLNINGLAGSDTRAVTNSVSADFRWVSLDLGDAEEESFSFAQLVSEDHDLTIPRPVLVVLVDGNDQAKVEETLKSPWGKAAAAKKWILIGVNTDPLESDAITEAWLRRLRIDFKVQSWQMMLLASKADPHPRVKTLVSSYPHQFVVAPLRGALNAASNVDEVLGAVEGHLAKEPGDQPRLAVSRALDDFHDAAAKADEDRYFSRFRDNAVFHGTDGSERWTKAQFEEWAMPYFQRDSAWIYVPTFRSIDFDESKTVAWFDEKVVNTKYGECRGTGVIVKTPEAWKIAQYNLTIPVPNELAGRLLSWIREESQEAPKRWAKLFLVRHAEKDLTGDSRDPQLTKDGIARAQALAHVLQDEKIDAIFSSPFKRTRDTVAPLAKQKSLSIIERDPRQVTAFVDEIHSQFMGKTVVVSGHSNTVPDLLSALGFDGLEMIDHWVYDHLFLVRVSGNSVLVDQLRFGKASEFKDE